ncbi:MAG: hypothetical protein QOJ65_728 [Fimbriimonadaceae bacterium]|jgi:Tfp pilus assembly protein PilX|nr:hypothetical protein [Fimbriimonadaceae bacterium]
MKKRKKPIFIGALLVILLLVVGAMNASSLKSATPPNAEEDSLAAQAKLDEAEARKRDEQIAALKSGTTKDKQPLPAGLPSTEAPEQTNVKKISALAPGAPKLLAPRNLQDRTRKPERASVTAQGQWYHSESGMHGK